MLEKIYFCAHCGAMLEPNPGAELRKCENCGSLLQPGQIIAGLFTPQDAEMLRKPLMERESKE